MYKTFKAGDKEYKLRLTTRNAIVLEEKLGKHPLSVLMNLEDGTLPATGDICLIIWAGLQSLEHNIKLDDVYDIYDALVDDGAQYEDILAILIDVFKSGGFITEEATESPKNK